MTWLVTRDTRLTRFLDEVATADLSPPLSDIKLDAISDPERLVVIEEADAIVAVGVVAVHLQSDSTRHWAVETVLRPGLRFAAFEDRLLKVALDLVPRGDPRSVWSHRRSLDAALVRARFTVRRELGYLVVGLPIPGSEDVLQTRPFRAEEDAAAVLALNAAAFAGHREAASLNEEELGRLMAESWFDPSGLLIHEERGAVDAFCWTRVHADGSGEIFRIAVAPRTQGRGLGRAMVNAGFDYLARQQGLERGTLWVDKANRQAISLYRSIGMTEEVVNREWEYEDA
ncbi:MAG: N-acetyltransferase [Actinomycetota bacterium]|nr:N-acetyltransferase [Actinomycetota bacterium]